MAQIKEIRAELVTLLTGVAALTSAFPDGYRVSAYPASNPTPPQIEIGQFSVEKHQAMANGAEWWTANINAYVAVTTEDVSLETADAFLENDPVSAAIEANRTLGGLVSDLIVDRAYQRSWVHPALKAPLAGVEYQLRILV
jgi:hypothetical protein